MTVAIIIGPRAACRDLTDRIERLTDPPHIEGWILTRAETGVGPVLGLLEQLPSIVDRHRPDLALLALPAAMATKATRVEADLRAAGVEVRTIVPLDELIAGRVGAHGVPLDLERLIDRVSNPVDTDSVRRVVAGRRVLVTGAGGSIGSELARRIIDFAPAHLALVDRAENALFDIDRQVARLRPELSRVAHMVDIARADAVEWLFEEERPDVVLHAAANKHVPISERHPEAAVDNNLFGTQVTADAAARCGTRRFVLISTDKAVNPTSVMGATKRLAEQYVMHMNQRHDMGFALVRFGNVIGSTGSVLDVWTRQLAEGGPLTVTDPDMTRYFMSIREAAGLVIQSAALVDPTDRRGSAFVLDMGDPIRIGDLVERFAGLHGLRAVWPGEPLPEDARGIEVVITGSRPGEKRHEELEDGSGGRRESARPGINIWTLDPPDDRYMSLVLDRLAPANRPRRPEDLARLVHELASKTEELSAAPSLRQAGV